MKGMDYIKKRYNHNSDDNGFKIVEKYSTHDNNFEPLIANMIEDAAIFDTNETNVFKITSQGEFAGRKLYVVNCKTPDSIIEDSFLFYKSLHGSGIKQINQYYPIPGIIVYPDVMDDNTIYYYDGLCNGWFIKDSKGISELYGVELFKQIQKYLQETLKK
jgi:hypothetical protein